MLLHTVRRVLLVALSAALLDSRGWSAPPEPARGESSAGRAELVAPVEPETVFVTGKAALARCGPGLDHYPTDVLPRGECLEVVERQDNWVSINPPEGSFSWVEGANVERTDGASLARVVNDDTKCWVGSAVDEVTNHECQVRLRRGEQVEVLDAKQVAGDTAAASTWLKIRPPMGEVRWVRAADLSPDPPVREDAVPASSPSAPQRRGRKVDADRSADRSAAPGSSGGETSDIRLREISGDGAGSGDWQPRTKGQGTASTSAARSAVPSRGGAGSGGASRRALAGKPGATFEEQLARLQVALSRAVAQAADSQQLAGLESEVDRLMRGGKSAYDRGRAALLLDSVRRFRDLADRKAQDVAPVAAEREPDAAADAGDGVVDVRLPGDVPEGQPSAAGGGLSPESTGDDEGSTDEQAATPYSAQGWLMPVAGPPQKAPPFVLMDADGHPVAFVTPAPGVNLRRYVKKEVGIVGERTFPVLNQSHVVAHRVVDLARQKGGGTSLATPWSRTRGRQR